jgi:2-polyprenyl-3-methyl-5-hydroxy-6-metoxy-1,4-benzoquinol methylase
VDVEDEIDDTADADGQEPKDEPIASGESRPGNGYRPHSASIYTTTVDPSVEVGAHSIVLRMVGHDKRVLELGCAEGSVTKVFAERGCRVTGIEIDPDAAQIAKEWADDVIVGDLDVMDVTAALGDATFDVIVAADVLEHLRDPKRCLDACLEHLAPGGEVVLSIPNVAHADLRLALLQGEFEYQPLGLLDETHLRFFTRQSLERFLDESDLVVLEWDRTSIPTGATEIPWDRSVNAQTLAWVSAQPDADTYQFVLRAAHAPNDSHLRELAAQRDEARTLVAKARALEHENSVLRARVDALTEAEAERDAYRASFEELAGVQDELVAVRRSKSFRLGRMMYSPIITARRVMRAWKRAERASGT